MSLSIYLPVSSLLVRLIWDTQICGNPVFHFGSVSVFLETTKQPFAWDDPLDSNHGLKLLGFLNGGAGLCQLLLWMHTCAACSRPR